MKKILLSAFAMLACTTAWSAGPSDRLNSAIDNIQMECPYEINNGWVIQNIAANDETVTITMIVDLPSDKFDKMKADPDTLKGKFLNAFATKVSKKGGIVAETADSGLNLEVDMVSPTSIEPISLIFSPAELTKALSEE